MIEKLKQSETPLILDCTIRDGGYLNDWQFSKQMVKDLYRAVSKSGVDIIEVGFRSSNRYFDPKQMGVWRFTPEEVVNEIVNEIAGAPISLMVDYGKIDLEDIPIATNSNVSMYRIAVHKNEVIKAIELADAIADKGYMVSIQLMGIVGYSAEDFKNIIVPLRNSRLSYVYFADSYGSLFPTDIDKYVSILSSTDKPIGFHAHNNLQLAFANTLEAIKKDINIIDGTVFGMGRGVGNLALETLITYFEKTVDSQKYNVIPILELIDKYFLYLYKEFNWGYNMPYMLSGIYEVHPNYANALIESGEYTIDDMQLILQLINQVNPIGFDKNVVSQIAQSGFIGRKRFEIDILSKVKEQNKNEPYAKNLNISYKDRHKGKIFLILTNGPSIAVYRDKIDQFIRHCDPIIIGSNYLGGLYVPHYHSFNNERRFVDHVNDIHPDSMLLVSSEFNKEFITRQTEHNYEIVQHSEEPHVSFSIENGVIMNNCKAVSILSIAVAIVMGAKRIFIAGMDGYKDLETFMTKGIHIKPESEESESTYIKLSARSGDYKEQMEWHNYIERTLRQINDYLISTGYNELIIITPTTHKSFYKSIDSFLR